MSEIFNNNITALAQHQPQVAQQITDAQPLNNLSWIDTKQDVPSAILNFEERKVTLASRFKPLDEAARLADTADYKQYATIILMGFGLGYHADTLIRNSAGKALIVIYEPNISLLRTVLEHIDYSQWLSAQGFYLIVGQPDLSALTNTLEPAAGSITQGTQFIYHPATRQHSPQPIENFTQTLKQFVAFCRTNVTTTLVNTVQTCHNLIDNLAHYTAGHPIRELKNTVHGYPAIIVSAGPSLAKNVHLLKQPGIRDRVVIIAVQTALKPLLAHGVRPHFVTSLDYHNISKRFYEDLPDLPDVTLIAEPKANRTILESFPGPIRVLQNDFLDTLLGPLKQPIGKLKAGSTVAHLSFYFAQYLGCDPIAFIGQDLGFSEGLYYCPGTAIHEVWQPELNRFNTLENMEWRRIVRHKNMLHRTKDIYDRPIFSDEQMMTYLRQFERDFMEAPQQIIDATEGGLPKQHTQTLPLNQFLNQHATEDLPTIPLPDQSFNTDRITLTIAQLQDRLTQVSELQQLSHDSLEILHKMLKHQKDQQKMIKLFEKLDRKRKRVEALNQTFKLVNNLNQVGSFRRNKADRAIRITEDADPYTVQRMQLERDIDNINWLVDACTEVIAMFNSGVETLQSTLDNTPTTSPSHTTTESSPNSPTLATTTQEKA